MKGDDKFAGLGWTAAGSGSPLLEGVIAWIDCDIETVTDAGDHLSVLGRVRELDVAHDGPPLVFFRGGYGRFAV
jgi:flavin reductase (DIM6/NTAB) family NADH-FMN oxidoreductase RutF